MAPPNQPAVREVEQDVEAVLRALAPRHRRLIVAYLEERVDDVTSVEALVDHLRNQSASTPSDRQVALVLHHAHLPALDAHGLLEYAPADCRVRYEGHPLVAPVLAVVGTGP